MKQLPDEETMLEILEELKQLEQAAREMSEMAYSIAYNTQKRVAEFQAEASKKHGQQTTQ
jgi:hypothetical protein